MKIVIKTLLIILLVQLNLNSAIAGIFLSQPHNLIIKEFDSMPKIPEKINEEEAMKQLESFESYRPDTYSDATRNPFDPKRYQFKNLEIFTFK